MGMGILQWEREVKGGSGLGLWELSRGNQSSTGRWPTCFSGSKTLVLKGEDPQNLFDKRGKLILNLNLETT